MPAKGRSQSAPEGAGGGSNSGSLSACAPGDEMGRRSLAHDKSSLSSKESMEETSPVVALRLVPTASEGAVLAAALLPLAWSAVKQEVFLASPQQMASSLSVLAMDGPPQSKTDNKKSKPLEDQWCRSAERCPTRRTGTQGAIQA